MDKIYFNYNQVSAGYYHTCGIDDSGQLYCWGYDGENRCSGIPVSVSNWVSVSAGGYHTCGIDDSGQMHCWGYDYHNQCSSIPTSVSNWASVSAGGYHTCGIDGDTGQLHCWGYDGNNQCSGIPVSVSNWVYVATGSNHTCGIDDSGQMHCWGHNYYGQSSDIPTSVSNWVSVSTGKYHTCGIDDSGQLHCWGRDSNNQCSGIPVSVSNWVSVSTGEYHTCGIDDSGQLYCWGQDNNNQCSDIPTSVSNWAFVSAGGYHTCGIDGDTGQLHCWGHDDYNQCSSIPYLDFEITTDKNKYYMYMNKQNITINYSIDDIFLPYLTKFEYRINGSSWIYNGINTNINIDIGMIDSININTIEVRAIGIDNDGNNIESNILSFEIEPILNKYLLNYNQVSAGGYHTCGIDDSGQMHCWVYDYYNQCSSIPTSVSNWASVSAGGQHTCGIDDTGQMHCWGHNYYGQSSDIPTSVSNWTSASTGGSHTCGIDNNGQLYCWGHDGYGQVTNIPVSVSNWVYVATGGYHTCGIDDSGQLYCWGQDNNNQCSDIPTSVSNWVYVATGGYHTCGIDGDTGQLHCWGHDDYNQCSDTIIPTLDFEITKSIDKIHIFKENDIIIDYLIYNGLLPYLNNFEYRINGLSWINNNKNNSLTINNTMIDLNNLNTIEIKAKSIDIDGKGYIIESNILEFTIDSRHFAIYLKDEIYTYGNIDGMFNIENKIMDIIGDKDKTIIRPTQYKLLNINNSIVNFKMMKFEVNDDLFLQCNDSTVDFYNCVIEIKNDLNYFIKSENSKINFYNCIFIFNNKIINHYLFYNENNNTNINFYDCIFRSLFNNTIQEEYISISTLNNCLILNDYESLIYNTGINMIDYFNLINCYNETLFIIDEMNYYKINYFNPINKGYDNGTIGINGGKYYWHLFDSSEYDELIVNKLPIPSSNFSITYSTLYNQMYIPIKKEHIINNNNQIMFNKELFLENLRLYDIKMIRKINNGKIVLLNNGEVYIKDNDITYGKWKYITNNTKSIDMIYFDDLSNVIENTYDVHIGGADGTHRLYTYTYDTEYKQNCYTYFILKNNNELYGLGYNGNVKNVEFRQITNITTNTTGDDTIHFDLNIITKDSHAYISIDNLNEIITEPYLIGTNYTYLKIIDNNIISIQNDDLKITSISDGIINNVFENYEFNTLLYRIDIAYVHYKYDELKYIDYDTYNGDIHKLTINDVKLIGTNVLQKLNNDLYHSTNFNYKLMNGSFLDSNNINIRHLYNKKYILDENGMLYSFQNNLINNYTPIEYYDNDTGQNIYKYEIFNNIDHIILDDNLIVFIDGSVYELDRLSYNYFNKRKYISGSKLYSNHINQGYINDVKTNNNKTIVNINNELYGWGYNDHCSLDLTKDNNSIITDKNKRIINNVKDYNVLEKHLFFSEKEVDNTKDKNIYVFGSDVNNEISQQTDSYYLTRFIYNKSIYKDVYINETDNYFIINNLGSTSNYLINKNINNTQINKYGSYGINSYYIFDTDTNSYNYYYISNDYKLMKDSTVLLNDIIHFEYKNERFMVIDKNFNLYGFGKNDQNQIRNKILSNEYINIEDCMINGPILQNVIGLSCGLNHTMVIVLDYPYYKLYGWGDNTYKQIINNTASNINWIDPDRWLLTNVKKVICGDNNTFILDWYNNLYSWGLNDYRQTNPDNSNNITTYQKIIMIPSQYDTYSNEDIQLKNKILYSKKDILTIDMLKNNNNSHLHVDKGFLFRK